jgi:hypothetical protein
MALFVIEGSLLLPRASIMNIFVSILEEIAAIEPSLRFHTTRIHASVLKTRELVAANTRIQAFE